MAEDVNTILDIVKAVDEKRFLEEDLVDKALTQKDPVENLKKGGTFKGSIYFSNRAPKDTGEPPKSNKEINDILRKVLLPGVTNEEVMKAQQYLASDSVRYLHPEDIDGILGPKTIGAVKRHRINTNPDVEDIFDRFKTWKDNMLNWGK